MLYKRISACESDEDLRELQVELIDRFGLLPEPAKNLMRIAAIKRAAHALGIEKIDAGGDGGYLVFAEESHIDPVALVQLVQNESQIYRLQGSHRLRFQQPLERLDRRFAAVENLLDTLRVNVT